MSPKNYILLFATIIFSCVLHTRNCAFYYIQELSTIPANLLEPYKRKHHLSDSFSAIFERGLKAYSAMDYDRAEQAYNTLLLINSQDIIALERLAQVYLKQGKITLAVNTLLQILRIEPQYHPAHNHLAQVYLYAKDPKQSIRHAKHLIENGLAYVETYLSLVNAFFMLKQFDNMVSICRIAKEKTTHPQFLFFELIAKWIADPKAPTWSIDLNDFKTKFESDPDYNLYEYLINIFTENKDAIARTERDFRKNNFKGAIYPKMFLAVALDSMSYVTQRVDISEKAIDWADKVVDQAANFILPYRLSLNILRERRDFQGLLNRAIKGVKKFPENIEFLEYQGEAAFFVGESDLALNSLQNALQVRNSNPYYLAYTAILMLQNKTLDPQEAFSLIDLALNQDPNNEFAQTALGLFYFKAGEPQRSLISLRQAMQKKIQHPLAWDLAIQIHRSNKSTNQAYQSALKAVEIVKDETLYKHAIELHKNREEYNKAIALAEESRIHIGNSKYINYLLADSHKQLGDRDLKRIESIDSLSATTEEKKLLEKLSKNAESEFKQALEALEQNELKVSDPESHNLLYLNLLVHLKKETKALDWVNELIRVHKYNPAYRVFLGNYYYQQANKEAFKKALEQYQILVKVTGLQEYRNEIGWLTYLIDPKDIKNAIDLITSSRMRGDNVSRALANYRLGLIYGIDKNPKSTAFYNQAYELAPKLTAAKMDHQLFGDYSDNKVAKGVAKRLLKEHFR